MDRKPPLLTPNPFVVLPSIYGACSSKEVRSYSEAPAETEFFERLERFLLDGLRFCSPAGFR
jgi:hypothetical protein